MKVSRSYWPGLFHCYDVAGPAADEQRPGAVVRQAPVPRAAGERPEGGVAGAGGAGLGPNRGRGGDAAAAPNGSRDLSGADRAAWRALRATLDERRQRRVERRRFRRDPERLSRHLEDKLNQSRLPT